MTPYELIPKRSNTTARSMVMVLMIGAFALMFFTVLFPTLPFRWVVQLIALVLLTAGIFMTTRYLTKLFIYRIISDGASFDLTVTEAAVNGKRQVTVCRVGLGGIQERCLLEQSNAEETKKRFDTLKKEQIKLYDYCVDYRPVKSILILAEEGEQSFAIRLSYDEELWSYLSPMEKEEEQE